MAVPESVEIAAAFDPAFAVEDVAVHTFENAVKVQCMVIPDSDIVSFYRRQKMQVRAFRQLRFDPGRGEAFIRYNDAFPDIIVPDKRSVGTGINAVAGKDLGAYRFHFLYVISIKNRNFPAAPHHCLAGKGGKVIYGTVILLKHPVDCDVMLSNHPVSPLLVEGPALCTVLPEVAEEGAYGVFRKSRTGIVPADKGFPVKRCQPV